MTTLAVILVLAGGIFTYRSLPVELFPEIEFPLVTVTTFYPSANPEAVARDVTEPIESAMSGLEGLDTIQSFSSENRSIVLATFEFGTDMAQAESETSSSVNAVSFPELVADPIVGRIDPDAFPVLQLSITGERDLVELQEILEADVLPVISDVPGVFGVEVAGEVQRQVNVAVDPAKMEEKGISLFQVSQALADNSVALPGGVVSDSEGKVFPIKTSSRYESLDDLRELSVGFPRQFPMDPGAAASGPPAQVTLGEIAEISLSAGTATSISRTNGKPSIGVSVIKDPDANTIDVTREVLDRLDAIDSLPLGVELVTISNDGPVIQDQITTLEREAVLGLLLAVTVVFIFFLTLRPSAVVGVLTTLRPTMVDWPVHSVKHLHGRAADELAGPCIELYDPGRSGHIRRPRC